MVVVQIADESSDIQEHGGWARGWKWLPEMHRYDFEKIKTKNFRKRAKGADSRRRAVMEAIEHWIYREGVIDPVIEHKSDKNVT
jgi:hypothetical protein